MNRNAAKLVREGFNPGFTAWWIEARDAKRLILDPAAKLSKMKERR